MRVQSAAYPTSFPDMASATSSTDLLDLEAPLVPQVGGLGDAYDAWIHRSIRRKTSLRMFRSDLLEAMSHIPWWLVLVVWVPIGAALLVVAVRWGGLDTGAAAASFGVGALGWTLF